MQGHEGCRALYKLSEIEITLIESQTSADMAQFQICRLVPSNGEKSFS